MEFSIYFAISAELYRILQTILRMTSGTMEYIHHHSPEMVTRIHVLKKTSQLCISGFNWTYHPTPFGEVLEM